MHPLTMPASLRASGSKESDQEDSEPEVELFLHSRGQPESKPVHESLGSEAGSGRRPSISLPTISVSADPEPCVDTVSLHSEGPAPMNEQDVNERMPSENDGEEHVGQISAVSTGTSQNQPSVKEKRDSHRTAKESAAHTAAGSRSSATRSRKSVRYSDMVSQQQQTPENSQDHFDGVHRKIPVALENHAIQVYRWDTPVAVRSEQFDNDTRFSRSGKSMRRSRVVSIDDLLKLSDKSSAPPDGGLQPSLQSLTFGLSPLLGFREPREDDPIDIAEPKQKDLANCEKEGSDIKNPVTNTSEETGPLVDQGSTPSREMKEADEHVKAMNGEENPAKNAFPSNTSDKEPQAAMSVDNSSSDNLTTPETGADTKRHLSRHISQSDLRLAASSAYTGSARLQLQSWHRLPIQRDLLEHAPGKIVPGEWSGRKRTLLFPYIHEALSEPEETDGTLHDIVPHADASKSSDAAKPSDKDMDKSAPNAPTGADHAQSESFVAFEPQETKQPPLRVIRPASILGRRYSQGSRQSASQSRSSLPELEDNVDLDADWAPTACIRPSTSLSSRIFRRPSLRNSSSVKSSSRPPSIMSRKFSLKRWFSSNFRRRSAAQKSDTLTSARAPDGQGAKRQAATSRNGTDADECDLYLDISASREAAAASPTPPPSAGLGLISGSPRLSTESFDYTHSDAPVRSATPHLPALDIGNGHSPNLQALILDTMSSSSGALRAAQEKGSRPPSAQSSRRSSLRGSSRAKGLFELDSPRSDIVSLYDYQRSTWASLPGENDPHRISRRPRSPADPRMYPPGIPEEEFSPTALGTAAFSDDGANILAISKDARGPRKGHWSTGVASTGSGSSLGIPSSTGLPPATHMSTGTGLTGLSLSIPPSEALSTSALSPAQEQPSPSPTAEHQELPQLFLDWANAYKRPVPEKPGSAKGRLRKGIDLFQRGDLRKALAHFRSATHGNLRPAMLLYAIALQSGWGCTPRPTHGFRYLKVAAESLIEELNTYSGEDGTLHASPETAERLKKELLFAVQELAWCYQLGRGTSRDTSIALQYFKLGASLGGVESLEQLAYCYQHGAMGVTHDAVKAARYRKLARAQGAIDTLGTAQSLSRSAS